MAMTKAEMDKWLRDRGHGQVKPKKKPVPPTAAQVRMKKSEGIRKKYTPSGLQGMIDAMGKKKPKGKK